MIGEWHKSIQDLFLPENREVILGKHRADILINGLVIEVQNSYISASEIRRRENHYQNMIWVLNGKNFDVELIPNIYKERETGRITQYNFWWRNMPKCWLAAKKPILVDFGEPDSIDHFINLREGGSGTAQVIYNSILKV